MVKLTPKQKEVIRLLKKGEIIVHDERNFFVTINDGWDTQKISWRTWDVLTKKHHLIGQQLSHPFNYGLTPLADKINIS